MALCTALAQQRAMQKPALLTGWLPTTPAGVDLKRKMIPDRASGRWSRVSRAPPTRPKVMSQHRRCFMSTKRAVPVISPRGLLEYRMPASQSATMSGCTPVVHTQSDRHCKQLPTSQIVVWVGDLYDSPIRKGDAPLPPRRGLHGIGLHFVLHFGLRVSREVVLPTWLQVANDYMPSGFAPANQKSQKSQKRMQGGAPGPIIWNALMGGWWLICSRYNAVPLFSVACQVSPKIGLKGFRHDWKQCWRPATNLQDANKGLLSPQTLGTCSWAICPQQSPPHAFKLVRLHTALP